MARQVLAEANRGAVNAREGQEVAFDPRIRELCFKVEDFVLCFSLPNLNFHATTAYDLLRSRGVDLGKRDYLGGGGWRGEWPRSRAQPLREPH